VKSVATVNLTVRVDEHTKKDFDGFCSNVGINATAAVNMFIKNVVRTRTLPFIVTDVAFDGQDNKSTMANMKRSIKSMQEKSAINGNSEMTLDEINAEISAYRKEKRESNA
jgi:DNA-damage-inducible protein J